MWERGVRDSRTRGQQASRWLLVTATMVAAGVLVVLAARESAPVNTDFRPGTPAPADTPAASSRTYTLDGADPGAFPEDRTGLAFLDLEDALHVAEREFGPAHDRQPDINETVANVWHLPGEAEFAVVTVGVDPDDAIVGLAAAVPQGSGVRVAAYRGVVLGRSTPAEIVQAWGADYDRSSHPGDDYVIRYTLCRDGWPVVVKFDHYAESGSWDDDPVGRVLIAYTDDDPAPARCPPV